MDFQLAPYLEEKTKVQASGQAMVSWKGKSWEQLKKVQAWEKVMVELTGKNWEATRAD